MSSNGESQVKILRRRDLRRSLRCGKDKVKKYWIAEVFNLNSKKRKKRRNADEKFK
jgi:hypothetical protein